MSVQVMIAGSATDNVLDDGRHVDAIDVMELLRLHVPLTLLIDLVDPTGPHSREMLDDSWLQRCAG